MRIVAGSCKGHRIEAPKGVVTRPTSDRVREAVFSILGSVEGARTLDLFAGSGAMGLEALSRGAASCVFVERERRACGVIERNLERLRLDGGSVLCRDAVRALCGPGLGRFELVLVDPPYDEWASLEEELGPLLRDALEPGAMLVVETAVAVDPQLPLDLVTTRRYGSARITVFSR